MVHGPTAISSKDMLTSLRIAILILVPYALVELYGRAWEQKASCCVRQKKLETLLEENRYYDGDDDDVNNNRIHNNIHEDDDPLVAANRDLIRARPRNLQLVFIGDSVMRFQYLSLAHWLRYGRWLPNGHASTKTYGGESLMDAHSFHHEWHPEDDWNEFFLHSNRILNPNEVCDCWRETIPAAEGTARTTASSNDNEIPLPPRKLHIEHRYFYEPTRNNKLVFINLPGDERDSSGFFQGYLPPYRVWDDFTPGLVGGRVRHNQSWHRDPRSIQWSYASWSELLANHVGELDVANATLILNAGLHRHRFNELQVANALEATVHEGRVAGRWKHAIWKTTTRKREHSWETEAMATALSSSTTTTTFSSTNSRYNSTTTHNRHDVDMCLRLGPCLNVSWTHELPDRYYLDRLHFVEPVYRVMNEQLLDQLHLLPDDYDRLTLPPR